MLQGCSVQMIINCGRSFNLDVVLVPTSEDFDYKEDNRRTTTGLIYFTSWRRSGRTEIVNERRELDIKHS